MASIKKYTFNQVAVQLGHGARTNNSTAPHIHHSKTTNNTILSPDRQMSPYDYFLTLRKDLYIFNRNDLKEMIEIVITEPEDSSNSDIFFNTTYQFLNERFGGGTDAPYCLLCVIHQDEDGVVLQNRKPHMHYYAIPVEHDKKRHKPSEKKIGSSKLLSRANLRSFHPDFQAYLKKHNISGTVQSGIVQQNGGNQSIYQLKQNDHHHERGYVYDWN